jgi:hypothetical protein
MLEKVHILILSHFDTSDKIAWQEKQRANYYDNGVVFPIKGLQKMQISVKCLMIVDFHKLSHTIQCEPVFSEFGKPVLRYRKLMK